MVAPGRIVRRSPAVALLAAASIAGSAAGGSSDPLTALRVRIGDHPAFVRAVVDFGGGTFTESAVTATDPGPFDGGAGVRLARPHVRTVAGSNAAFGLRVRVIQRTNHLQIVLTSAPRRFKYLSYAVVGRTRLAIDMWKSAPRSPAATIRVGAHGCLTLAQVATRAGVVSASGRERDLFEHQFQALVRGRDGRVLGGRHAHATAGRWSARVGYRAPARQSGTIEAAAASPKDGALACLVQARVTLPRFP